MGKPPIAEEPGRTKSVILTQEQIKMIEEAARSEQTTQSDIVRRALRKYFVLGEKATDSPIVKG